MTDQEYLAQRLQDQLDWFERKAAWNQRWHKRLRMTEIVAAALIPSLVAFGMEGDRAQAVSAALGILIAISAGAMGLFKFHENWVQYRTTAEQLKHERFLYETASGPYRDSDRYAVLVEQVEGLLMKDVSAWSRHGAPQSGPAGPNPTQETPPPQT
jgi:Protein of unknown function (DUF4231)